MLYCKSTVYCHFSYFVSTSEAPLKVPFLFLYFESTTSSLFIYLFRTLQIQLVYSSVCFVLRVLLAVHSFVFCTLGVQLTVYSYILCIWRYYQPCLLFYSFFLWKNRWQTFLLSCTLVALLTVDSASNFCTFRALLKFQAQALQYKFSCCCSFFLIRNWMHITFIRVLFHM